jgi:hypothetical protein
MAKPTPEELRKFEQQLADKRRHAPPKPPGPLTRAWIGTKDWFAAAGKKVAKAWSWLDPIAHRVIRVGAWSAPKLGRLSWNTAILISCKKTESGTRQFNFRYLSLNLVKIALTCVFFVMIATPVYYYSTWSTYRDIYIPNAGVFVNEQFVRPSGAGQVIAPRDEIFTVLGKVVDDHGQVQPIRFDIDFNALFFFYSDAIRPDLAAAKLDSQSPYGVKCTVEATGIYNRLPRIIRIWALKWWDVRPEIVRVVSCEELKEIPPFMSQDQTPVPPKQ